MTYMEREQTIYGNVRVRGDQNPKFCEYWIQILLDFLIQTAHKSQVHRNLSAILPVMLLSHQ